MLVIIGLIIGGIMTGKGLLRASEVRSVAADYAKLAGAVQSFKDKFSAIPGDFSGATQIWGRYVVAATCVTNSAAAVTTPGTCDGDGDSLLGTPAATSASAERFQFWKHLQLAGLIDGNYTGLSGTAGKFHAIPGTNTPVGKLSNSGWNVITNLTTTYTTDGFTTEYGNTLHFGGALSPGGAVDKILTPEEAWGIDTKMDDGRPAYGMVLAFYLSCSTPDTGTSIIGNLDQSYNLGATTKECSLVFRNAW